VASREFEEVWGMRETVALKLRIVGIVQGVGFRPFIYRLAVARGVGGYVVNLGGSDVEVYVEGERDSIVSFLRGLIEEKPPPARIEGVDLEVVEPRGFRSFSIRRSERRRGRRSIIPPDFGICVHCLAEIHSAGRFYKYPWNSCAWCGPRFSMMYDVPYDRDRTSMRAFPLCEECRRDYEDPYNIRRFHAQGISCKRCGPATRVFTADGRELVVDDPVEWAARRLEEGYIIAVKGVGGYHIAALASNDSVVAELRRRKGRPAKPFALMVRDCRIASRIVVIPRGACAVLSSAERPILLLPRRPGAPVSELVAPGLDKLGVMLPYTGFQALLLERMKDGFLIMTSGNRSGAPMCTSLECVIDELADIVDYIVDHERVIVHRVDDSVLRYTAGRLVFLRRSRGYAPAWIYSPFNIKESIAVGAELQNAGAVGFEDKIVPTQYIGDMDEPGQIEELERELNWLIRVYGLKPRVIAVDKHPFYRTRSLALRLAEKYGAEIVEVQHHHAHAASAMLEYNVANGETRVAITIDGAGYGEDGTIWGGEVLVVSYREFKRVGSLHSFPLPGGDRATLYPARALIGLLYSCGWRLEEVLQLLSSRNMLSPSVLPYGEAEARASYLQCSSSISTTSMGRTLDAAAVLLGVAERRSYEGEPAMRLEAAARGCGAVGFEAPVELKDGRFVVNTCALVEQVVDALDKHSTCSIAGGVQLALGRALGQIALNALRGTRLPAVVYVTGGASVNDYLVEGIREALGKEVEIRLQRKLPPGDGGIAVGQLAIASSRIDE